MYLNFRNIILFLIAVGGVNIALSQPSNRQVRRAESMASELVYDMNSGKNLRFFMSSRWMNGVDIQFTNLGQMDFQVLQEREDSRTYLFDDGFVTLDPADSEVTSNFGFQFDQATTGGDGYVDSFTLTGYSSESSGVAEDLEAESNLGVEMGMQYFFINKQKFKLGFVGSFGVNDLNADSTRLVEGELYSQMATVLLENSQITPVSGESYSSSGGRGPLIDMETGFLYDPNTRERVTQDVAGEGEVGVPAQVQGNYNLDGVTSGLRLGMLTEISLGRFWMQAGAGYTGVYTYSDFSVTQRMANANFTSNVEMDAEIQDSQWFYGPYAELRAGFRINPSSRIYVGALYINMDETFSQNAGGIGNRIGLENPIMIEFGVNIDF